jgi:chemotaxis protein methyltransferase CheR
MIGGPTPDEVERFRALVARRLGLHFEEGRVALVAEALSRRAGAAGESRQGYLDRLEAGDSPAETRALAEELTVGETYFFRNAEQFQALSRRALPERVAARAANRQLRLLSAGCASGEEPYSLAILVREHALASSWNVSILGVDVNASALERAAAARYSTWSLRETAADRRHRWFRASGREHQLDPSIQKAVRFEERNLAEDAPGLWAPETYDVILCRNVLMYLTPDCARAVVARVTRALAPGGYLFLGHAETLRGLSHDFHLRHTHGSFYYQRKVSADLGTGEATSEATPAWSDDLGAVADDASGSTWIETIRRSAARIEELAERRDGRPDDLSDHSPAARVPDVGRALELLEKERYAAALDALGDCGGGARPDADVLLLQAVLLTQAGRLEAAERVCTELRGTDDLNAGAHYVLALCREGAGDRSAAEEHDRMAAHLDPAFAMPRLHIGLIARRAGNLEGARRELGQALVLLAREDASRILLFGGGFSREALIHLCRAELRAVGGAP